MYSLIHKFFFGRGLRVSPWSHLCGACVCAAMTLAVVFPDSARANIVFPVDAGVVNVLDFGAIPGDGLDDTAAIQAAFDSGTKNRVVYLPDGVYDVSDTITYGINQDQSRRKFFIGQSRDGAVIRLQDNASGFSGSGPRPVIKSYVGSQAVAFRNSLYNMTIDVGSGNTDAVGVEWHNHNYGGMRDVLVKSSDPNKAGLYGVWASRVDNGPGLIKNVEVDGFDRGIEFGKSQFGMTFENITLRNQNEVGFRVSNQAAIRNLISVNDVPALQAGGPFSHVTLDGADLTGTGTAGSLSAINLAASSPGNPTTKPALLARGVNVAGYANAINDIGNLVPGPAVDHYTSFPVNTLFPSSTGRSLGLAVKDTPEIPLAAPADWVNVRDFGALPGGAGDSAGIQAAIDWANANGKTTLYFPSDIPGGSIYTIDETVSINGGIERIIGLGTRLTSSGDVRSGAEVAFRFENLAADETVFEQFASFSEGGAQWFEHVTDKTVVLRNNGLGRYTSLPGAGDLFIEDASGTDWVFGEGQNVWIRQINPESSASPSILNDGATVWIQGLKTEDPSVVIETRNGGKTELLGGFIYPTDNVPDDMPIFILDESEGSFSYVTNAFFGGQDDHRLHVVEIFGGERRELLRSDVVTRGGGTKVALYSSGVIPEPGATATVFLAVMMLLHRGRLCLRPRIPSRTKKELPYWPH